jgi:hypothetical protein
MSLSSHRGSGRNTSPKTRCDRIWIVSRITTRADSGLRSLTAYITTASTRRSGRSRSLQSKARALPSRGLRKSLCRCATRTSDLNLGVEASVDSLPKHWLCSETPLLFIFKIRCPIGSEYNQDSRPVREYYELIPDGYRNETLHGTIMTRRNKKILFVANEAAFWRAPAAPSSDF